MSCWRADAPTRSALMRLTMFVALGAACDAAPMPVSYFFVNRSDYVANVAPPALAAMVRDYADAARRASIDVDVTVYGYASARALVASVDASLLFFWDRVNLTYATILSNVFRYAVLLARGGVYHDAKMRPGADALRSLVAYLERYDVVLEENPRREPGGRNRKFRNTNMAAARPGLAYFNATLASMAAKLAAAYARRPTADESRKVVFHLDSHTAFERVRRDGKHKMLMAYACGGEVPKPNCTDAADVSGVVDGESWVGRKWRLETAGDIAAAYNAKGHWSTAHERIFLDDARPPP